MDTTSIELDRTRARELWRDYREHLHWSQPIDCEVMAAYQAIAQGRVVIRALDSIAKAGTDEHGLPRLAIIRADSAQCFVRVDRNGSAVFAMDRAMVYDDPDSVRNSRMRVHLPAGSLSPRRDGSWIGRALVPQVPLPMRPRRGTQNYHILFEADWTLAPPVDPMLLRRVGRSDLWIVCAAWDLTEIERAALAGRMHA